MFSMNGPLYRMGAFFYRYVALNLLFIVACVFIITIPAATAALFTVARKIVMEEDPAIFSTFWRGFVENLLQSSIAGLIMALIALFWWVDIRVLQLHQSALNPEVTAVLVLLAIVYATTLLHLFPVMVHMQLRLKGLFLMAFRLSFVNPLLTLISGVFLAVWYLICSHIPVLLVTFFFSFAATISYWLMDKKFKTLPNE